MGEREKRVREGGREGERERRRRVVWSILLGRVVWSILLGSLVCIVFVS